MSDPIGDADTGDAFGGSEAASDSQAYQFDSPDPGDAGLNTGVAGATVGPEQPIEGANTYSDAYSTNLDPNSLSGMFGANNSLPGDMLNNMRDAISSEGSSQGPSEISPSDSSTPFGANSSSTSGFPSSLTPWNQSTSLAMGGSPPSNEPGLQATQQAMDKSLSGWGSGGGSGFGGSGKSDHDDTGDALTKPSDFPTQQEADYGSGFNDSVWSDLGPGISTVGQDEMSGDTEGNWSNLGGWTTVEQDNASGINTPGPGFNSLGGSEGGSWAGNTAYMPTSGPESRGYDEAAGSNLVQPGDLYSSNPSWMAKIYSG
jgi:hypothetical protein